MIGIVGGVGPMAGVDLAKTIIQETDVVRDQDHIPFLLVSFPHKIVDRTAFILGKETENPAIAIAEILLGLEKQGATIGVIACNTAHTPNIFNEVKRILRVNNSSINLLNIITEVVYYIANRSVKQKVGVLSTLGSYQVGVYENELIKNNIDVVKLSEELAIKVHNAIYDSDYGIKANSICTEESKKILKNALDYFQNKGVSCVVLGCTEIPICFTEEKYKELEIINPGNIIARKAIQCYLEN